MLQLKAAAAVAQQMGAHEEHGRELNGYSLDQYQVIEHEPTRSDEVVGGDPWLVWRERSIAQGL